MSSISRATGTVCEQRTSLNLKLEGVSSISRATGTVCEQRTSLNFRPQGGTSSPHAN
ncbi:MAG: hypothetical protein SPL78_00500 [Bacteroidales bacterium]|nr:hypothetical protein [Bacteroidales bacterium]